MGMFDKDKQFGMRLDGEFPVGEHFILYGVTLTGETVATDFGDAETVRMRVAKLANPYHRYDVQTLASAIVEKAKEADDSDFPAIVKLMRVKGRYHPNTLVLQFVAPFTNDDATPSGAADSDEDIPF